MAGTSTPECPSRLMALRFLESLSANVLKAVSEGELYCGCEHVVKTTAGANPKSVGRL